VSTHSKAPWLLPHEISVEGIYDRDSSLIQPDVIKLHLTCAAGRRIVLAANTDRNGVDVGKVDARKRL